MQQKIITILDAMMPSRDVQRLRNVISHMHEAYIEWLTIYKKEQQQALEKIKELEDDTEMGS